MDTQNLQVNLQPTQQEPNEIPLDISIELEEEEEEKLTDSKKMEHDLKVIEDINSSPEHQEQQHLQERTEVMTEEILTDFLHRELSSIKIARDTSIEEENKHGEALQESPEPQQRDQDYELIREIRSEPSPAHESRVPVVEEV